jgi:chemotaxis protein CheD
MSLLYAEQFNHLEKVVIHPGEFYATNGEVMISTLLGSCVAACLFDPVNHVLGMNHFLLSSNLYKKSDAVFSTPSGRYGVHAMELLVNRMYQLGASRRNLQAKAFGGATLQGFHDGNNDPRSIGNANMAFVREFLRSENIPLMAEDMGGNRGRTIYFVSTDHSVFVRKHHSVKAVDLIKNEKLYHEKIKREQTDSDSNISLWG